MAKLSRYNHFQEWRDGFHIAYNALSGAVAVMPGDNYAAYKRIERKLASEPDPSFTPEEQELLKQLEYASFVYPGSYDERDELNFTHNISRYDSRSLGFVMAPTMACNMACEYCFETNKKGRMSDETIDSIISFVERNGNGTADVNIGWYGGEPLLAMDIIEKLTHRLLELGNGQKFGYTSSMVTNGYLLTRENVDRLIDLKVGAVQVTLDGPARIHNQKRRLKNGRPSYEAIVENMVYASSKMTISLRVNIDKTFDREMIAEMLDELDGAGLRDRIEVYFGLLEPSTTVCANISESCLTGVDFSKIEIDFFRLLLERGFKIEKLPSPISSFCVAQTVNGFVVDHEGNLYRCFNYIGDPEMSMGNIRNKLNYNDYNFTSLFKFDPFQNELCRDCNILPVCLGGCPARRMHRGVSAEEMCESWKHNLPEMLEIIALSRQQKVEAVLKEQS